MTTYVDEIEPRLTPLRPVRPDTSGEALIEWIRDLGEELTARLARIPTAALHWQPHPDANSTGVTAWHVARWLDVLGTRAFTGRPAGRDIWHSQGWCDESGYEPDGIGWRGLGTLTGYTPAEMRAVPLLSTAQLTDYLAQTTEALVAQITILGEAGLHQVGRGVTPYQNISGTVQGSFGHLGEIDALVALHDRLGGDRNWADATAATQERSHARPTR